jgi:hypothetical protein
VWYGGAPPGAGAMTRDLSGIGGRSAAAAGRYGGCGEGTAGGALELGRGQAEGLQDKSREEARRREAAHLSNAAADGSPRFFSATGVAVLFFLARFSA